MARANPDRALIHRMIAEGLVDQPLQNPLARSMHALARRAERGRVVLGFDVGAQFVHAEGALQGGVITIMLDFGAAMAAFSALAPDQSVATVSINVDFLRGAVPGRFEVDARLEKAGRRIVYAAARLVDDTGELVATATSPLVIV